MSDRVESSTPTVPAQPRLDREAFYSRPFRPPVTAWERRYRQWIIAADLAATVVVVVVVGAIMQTRHPHWGVTPLFGLPSLITLEVLTVGAVMLAFGLSRVWHPVVLGQGPEEFGRLGKGLFASIVALNVALLAAGSPAGARFWVFVVVPAIALLVFPQRYLARRWLHRARKQGRCLLPVLATGTHQSITDLIDRTKKAPHVGWRVAAACTVHGGSDERTEIDGVPVVGRFTDVAEHVKRGGYRIVAVTPDQYWTPERLRRLAWDLEGTGTEMVIAPGLMEVAGPRLHISGVLGMPLLRVSQPAFTGFSRLVKSVVDRVGSLVLLLLLSPLMLVTAVAVKLDSRGPVLFRQRRIGKDGVPFTVLKFRTMVPDADRMRADLIEVNEGAGLLFKLRRDPRVTRVGRLLRRYSIDELPQLFNVLAGSMSLVGPRPPLPEETARYAPSVRRRLLVKPGMTGLWQVSGRSELSWEESVRLDLRYVEDWSLALDLMILWKTLRAVIGGEGAY
uniref:Exopolysaccharide biosynthesis polyprenyl glycosylphosphotransferase n=1 Tax=Thermocrispum agreste TaxID=37925 RepID=A0A2W4K1J2_9PSEU|nr:MAG: exopolysaccharide biosynthesis polyprenyl glycosylphosphotransferase [Thermocrispum agreste]